MKTANTSITMKILLLSLFTAIVPGHAFAGETVVTSRSSYRSEECSGTHEGGSSIRSRSTGTPGAYYHSNLFRNAVVLINDTPGYMTFFVYSADRPGPADVDSLVRLGAHVYEIVVPPYQVSYTDQRARHYWVCSKPGKWGIDMMRNRIVPS